MGNVDLWLMSASFAIVATPGEIAGCAVAEPSRKAGEKSLLEMRLVQAWKCLPTVGYASCTVISVLVYAAVCGSMVATRGLPQPGASRNQAFGPWRRPRAGVVSYVAFSRFSVCTVSWMKIQLNVRFGDKIVH